MAKGDTKEQWQAKCKMWDEQKYLHKMFPGAGVVHPKCWTLEELNGLFKKRPDNQEIEFK